VKHKTASSFWKYYEHLPVDIRDLADKNFQLLKDNPSHPFLQFKKVGKIWSARVGSNYRAIATQIEEGYLWVWIGTHAEYDKLLR
jgi:mRNA-degrading endonuclease RelE of RelBE toxin-antitoxin system